MAGRSFDFPDDENGAVLRQMAEAGFDMTVEREIEFAHLAPDEEAAEQFAADAGSLGFDVAVYEPDEEAFEEGLTDWNVICTRRMVPSHREITQVENQLAMRAQKFGCTPDGWGSLS